MIFQNALHDTNYPFQAFNNSSSNSPIRNFFYLKKTFTCKMLNIPELFSNPLTFYQRKPGPKTYSGMGGGGVQKSMIMGTNCRKYICQTYIVNKYFFQRESEAHLTGFKEIFGSNTVLAKFI